MKRIHRDIVCLTDKYGEMHPVEDGTKITEDINSSVTEVSNGQFFKVWSECVKLMDDVEIIILMRLMEYVDHRDNTIRRDGEVMTVREMSDVVGREYTTLSKVVKSLVERRVMGKHSTEIAKYVGRRQTVYTINPYIMCKSKVVEKWVVEYYKPR